VYYPGGEWDGVGEVGCPPIWHDLTLESMRDWGVEDGVEGWVDWEGGHSLA
jgi:hypothetical protein